MKRSLKILFLTFLSVFLFLSFDLTLFLAPVSWGDKTAVRWILFGFSNGIFLLVFCYFLLLLLRPSSLQKKVLSLTIILPCLCELLFQTVVFVLSVCLIETSAVQAWSLLLTEFLGLFVFLSIFALCKWYVGRVESKTASHDEAVSVIHSARKTIAKLVVLSRDKAYKDEMLILSEKIRFTNPISNELTAEIDDQLLVDLSSLEKAIINKEDSSETMDCIKACMRDLSERETLL